MALGGNPDKSGYVSKTNLMEIVKREFELSLDLEAVIEGLQHDNLDYDVFCSIFEQDKERNEGRLASAASQRSLKPFKTAIYLHCTLAVIGIVMNMLYTRH